MACLRRMKPIHYILLFVISCSAGFYLARHLPAPAVTSEIQQAEADAAPTPTLEQLAQAYRQIVPIDLSLLEDFFWQKKEASLIYIYRSKCEPCEKQWLELSKLTNNLPLMAIAADDSPHDFASSLAVGQRPVKYTPYYVTPSRLLTLRRYLKDHGCRYDGPLPYLAIVDGKGKCSMAWQGFTAASAIDGVAPYVSRTTTATP